MTGTLQVFHSDSWLASCEARVERVSEEGIVLDQTVAFPEGGGQLPDFGEFHLENGATLRFQDVQKKYGRLAFLDDFPTVMIDAPIFHVIEKRSDSDADIRVGDVVEVSIDVERRAQLTTSHSAAHLVFLAVRRLRPEIEQAVRGCLISPTDSRFDFSVVERFSEAEMKEIEQIANEFVERDLPINVYPHPKEPQAWYWECEGEVMPCGGTHLSSTGTIGPIAIRRRNKGKNLERLEIGLKSPTYDLSRYR